MQQPLAGGLVVRGVVRSRFAPRLHHPLRECGEHHDDREHEVHLRHDETEHEHDEPEHGDQRPHRRTRESRVARLCFVVAFVHDHHGRGEPDESREHEAEGGAADGEALDEDDVGHQVDSSEGTQAEEEFGSDLEHGYFCTYTTNHNAVKMAKVEYQ